MSLNTFVPANQKGLLTPTIGVPTGLDCKVSDSESANLVSAQAVKISDVLGAQTVVTAVTAATDDVFGFVAYNETKSEFEAGKMTPVYTSGTVMVMEASTAIASGADVQVVPTGNKIVTATTGTVIGKALQKATADGDLIRVLIKL